MAKNATTKSRPRTGASSGSGRLAIQRRAQVVPVVIVGGDDPSAMVCRETLRHHG